MTSLSPIIPRSPWLASAGWTKKAWLTVEAKVASILRATWPDLPMPVQTIRPLALARISTARVNEPSRLFACADRASASAASTRRPTAMGSEPLIGSSLTGRHGAVLQIADRIARLLDPALGGLRLALHRGLHGRRLLDGRVAERLRRARAKRLWPDQRQGDGGHGGQGQQGHVEAIEHREAPIAARDESGQRLTAGAWRS